MGYQSIFREDLFAGRTVVITGGGSGIGRCTAHELAALGADVAIVGRNADKLKAVQAEIRSDGGRASIHAADIRDESAVSDVVDAILAEHGRIDGLFNNAGGQYRAPLETISTKG
ncbi:MAG: SDR family NAD(P)-dependent oxidoreductase, partial [Mycobacterium sp.]